MNIGALIVMFKLLQDAGVTVSPNGPPAPPPPNGVPEEFEIKPKCGPGKYAFKDPLSGLYSCVVIPKGR
jgi:hypothetical protein